MHFMMWMFVGSVDGEYKQINGVGVRKYLSEAWAKIIRCDRVELGTVTSWFAVVRGARLSGVAALPWVQRWGSWGRFLLP